MYCEPYPDVTYLIYSSFAPKLLYYSHIPAAVIALIFSLFIVIKNRQALEAKILVSISLLYSTWAIMNLFIWTQIDSRLVMYLWSFWFFIFALIFVLSFYFQYVFIKKGDVSFKIKALFGVFLFPILVLGSTRYNLSSFDLGSCNALENPIMIGYSYGLTTILFMAMVVFAFSQYYKASLTEKKQVTLVSLGVLLFLISFSVGTYVPSILNIFESSADTFAIEMYGFFGMSIFIGFLTYLIVRYKAFNIKLIAAQALILALVALIGSEFFFVTSTINRILVSITLFLAIVFGFFLVKSVKREIRQREELAIANAGQENLIHIMNHQIKGYLTKARNIFAELKSEPEYCPAESAKPMLEEGFKSATDGVDFVQQVLQGSSASSGKIAYAMKPLDLKALVLDAAEKQRSNAAAKSLTLSVALDDGAYTANADEMQLKEAVRNLIDNSIRYTQTGSISINLKKVGNKALLTVTDTGVGIDKDDMPKLFQKGGRGKDSLKYNVNSTGYGLAFVKGVVEAHKGRVWAESAGEGKGSTFYLELPLA